MKRTQIYLDEEIEDWLGIQSSSSGKSKSELIRIALKAHIDSSENEKKRLERLEHFYKGWGGYDEDFMPSRELNVAEERGDLNFD